MTTRITSGVATPLGTTEAMGSRLNLGNNGKQGARQCGCNDSDERENLNCVEINNDLGNDGSDADNLKIEF